MSPEGVVIFQTLMISIQKGKVKTVKKDKKKKNLPDEMLVSETLYFSPRFNTRDTMNGMFYVFLSIEGVSGLVLTLLEMKIALV